MFFFFLLRDKGKTDLSVKPQSITIFRKKKHMADDEENEPSRLVISTKPSQNLLVPYPQGQFTT
jgi:hypothetical protein